MPSAKDINDLIHDIAAAIPPGLKQIPEDLEKNLKMILEGAFDRMNLVTREEFDAQVKVLARTRAKLDALEKKLGDKEL